jgi:hypothetical protein
VELGGVDALHAAFLNESSIRGFVQCSVAGNTGPVGMTKGRAALPFRFDDGDDEQQVPPLRYAPVGMTLLLGIGILAFQKEVSSRPQRSAVEGPAVAFLKTGA